MSYGLLHRWSRNARSSVVDEVPARTRPVLRIDDIEHGWSIVDREGARVGKVAAMSQSQLTVARGLPWRRLHVPWSAVSEVKEGRIRLNESIASLTSCDRDTPVRRPRGSG